MNLKWDVKNIIERAVWTFVQAAVGAISVVAVQAAILGVNLTGLRAIGLTALAAGIASVLSLAKNLTAEGLVVQSVNRTQGAQAAAEKRRAAVMDAIGAVPATGSSGQTESRWYVVAEGSTPTEPTANERYVTARLASDAGSQPTKRTRKATT